MIKAKLIATVLAALLQLCLLVPAGNAQQSDVMTGDFGVGFIVTLGGKLYDDLWTATNVTPPEHRNPAFPDIAGVIDTDTWRCVSCHGWDYKGVEGERAVLGLHKAFTGLRHLSENDPVQIADKINKAHPSMPDKALPEFVVEVLAVFISVGQYNRDALLDDTNRVSGDTERGRDIFEGACVNCHQPDGRAVMKGETGDRSSLGWITRNRPEQALHKILNGVPGAEMLAVGFLEAHQIVNLFAYLQTLDPDEK